jgi:predicted transcriptional regulator
MSISDYCAKQVFSVEKSASLQQAAQLMKKHHVGALVVMEADGKKKPVGVLTDRDIVLTLVADNRSPATLVKEIMSNQVIKVSKDANTQDVIHEMEKQGVRRVVLVDSADQICGVVSSDDLLQYLAKEINGLGNLIDRQLENEKRHRPHMAQLAL